MRILLGNNTLAMLAGTETWTYTLARALKEQGHEVACYSSELGVISEKLKVDGIKSYSDLVSKQGIQKFSPFFTEPVNHDYDVIIANHLHVVRELRMRFPKTPIISTIHGILHTNEDGSDAPEHPALDAGVSQFVAVSEEVRALLRSAYEIDSLVIHNFFDIPKFATLAPAREKPEQFLINTNYHDRDDPVIQAVRDAAKHFGARVAAIGVNFNSTFDILKAIEESDVVFGMGRSVLEGVAAGRLGIVQGRWGTGGPIVESNLAPVRHFNFSGRNAENNFATPELLIKTIEEFYNPAVLAWGKSYMAREHNAVVAAETYVRLARGLTGAAINEPVAGGAVALDARPYKRAAV